ncbi:NAD(P)(+) transhydrogenase (Re/Si-specific) subunit beta [Saccharothrix algeriensis]|uniref:NAD(P) transhydrogenase subunit beta n=1 Tax=Saccharothrix algeriensis TaxID=173560 RepID=A0A8T8I276_9PSEU|nr:NAD(P)(+) transhydrogenase (Re/Si-specific) subunit beta [Saccharothrix algeriensis]MBM7810851.1 NAD(P) transhydrogenase subunit beta [Saccharothrix algeriensis]QTR04876.1 NAD(P)(+) transhydrogenase (Re/Si-specific) subunit beta [Saccharothrix algeriensis]
MTWVQLAYLAAALCFVLALKGLSTPRHARAGNLVGAAGMALAVVTAFTTVDRNGLLILTAVAAGAVVGVPAARQVRMTAIPQMVALFNGVGGAAAALVALAEFLVGHDTGPLFAVAAVLTVLIGAVSTAGSAVTFLKLQEVMTTRPVLLPAGRVLGIAVAAASALLAVAALTTGSPLLLVLLALAGLVLGVLFVLPVGGADVPIAISLLNAFTGLAVAASGYVLGNTLLIVAGTLVGASGTILTRLMAQAMGRSLANILFGAFRAEQPGAVAGEQRTVRSGTVEDVAILLGYAHSVLVVPGYGLAVAQAQHAARELAQLLESRGIAVDYGIHPVAGRMPGHMNVLLAEADVPYEHLKELDDVNPGMGSVDVVLVVGANDVVNPGARDEPSSPIYGMPIFDVDRAKAVVFMKRSMRPGFAGVDNSLLYHPKTTLLFGDAKDSLTRLLAAVKQV